MKRVIAIAIGVLGLLAGAIGVSHADAGDNNDHGLCTAYFNGQKNGHGEGENQDNQPPPFQELQTTGEDYTETGDDADNDRDTQTDEGGEAAQLTTAENIFNHCNDNSTIGGNPVHGRFTCVDEGGEGTGPDTETDPECNLNDAPGNS